MWIFHIICIFRLIAQQLSKVHRDVHARFAVLIVPCPTAARHLSIIKRILENSWLHINTANVIVLLPANEIATRVYTFFPFSPLHECEHVVPSLVAVYTLQYGFSGSVQLFPDKYDNLQGCPLRIASYSTPPFVMFRPHSKDAKTGAYSDVDGIDGLLMRALSQRMNYTQLIVDGGMRGDANKTHNATGCIALVIGKRVNLTVGHYGLSQSRAQLMLPSEPIYDMALVIAVPPGVPYTALQRLLQPFHSDLWTLLSGVFSAAVATVLLLDRCAPRRWRSLFLGADRVPLLSTVAVALGCGISPLPRRNLGRFMFISWTLLLFVLRNTYLGCLCYFMQSGRLRARPSTMVDMVAANYTIQLEYGALAFVMQIPQLADAHFQIVHEHEYETNLQTMPVITADIGVVTTTAMLAYYSRLGLLKYGATTVMPAEHLRTVPIVLFMPHGSALKPSLNQHIRYLVAGGIIGFWFKTLVPHMPLSSRRASSTEPRQLSLEPLLGTFVLCAVLLLVAFVVFALEVLVHWCQRNWANNCHNMLVINSNPSGTKTCY